MRVNELAARVEERRDAAGAQRFREALRRAGERAADDEAGEGPGAVAGEERADAARPGNVAAEPGVSELRALVRTLPVAIDASRIRAGEPLALSFGRALDVEIRPAPSGVEIVLRPAPRLARAAAAELPGIVAALRGRGLVVVRACVRARGAAPGSGTGAAAR